MDIFVPYYGYRETMEVRAMMHHDLYFTSYHPISIKSILMGAFNKLKLFFFRVKEEGMQA